MDKELSKEEFLEKKKDFSPFLVHLTREDEEYYAKDVLKIIPNENTLRAYNHFCYFSPALNNKENPESALLQDEFRVVLYVPYIQGKEQASQELCRLLALVTLCEEGNDWHWEREWRIVGDLEFKRDDIFCGLCPEDDIQEFEYSYKPVKFISPSWGINKILLKLHRLANK